MKTRLLESIDILRFDDKWFFSTLLGFTPFWDCTSNNENINQKITNLGTIDKFN